MNSEFKRQKVQGAVRSNVSRNLKFFVIKVAFQRTSSVCKQAAVFAHTIDSSNHFLNRTANIIKFAHKFCGFAGELQLKLNCKF